MKQSKPQTMNAYEHGSSLGFVVNFSSGELVMIRQSIFALLISLSISFSAAAQDAKLVEQAKKEGGKLIVYGSLESFTVEPIAEAFQEENRHHGGILARFSDQSHGSGAQRNARRQIALRRDVEQQRRDARAQKRRDVHDVYFAGGRGVSKEVTDPELGPIYRNTPIGIVYNKGAVKPADAPKSLEDLLNPKYKGKFVMPDPTQHTTTLQWLASLYKIMGKEKAEKFIRDLGATKPLLVESFAPSAERVSTGETPMGISLVRYVVTFSEKGAPVDYVRLGKMLSLGQYISLSSKAPRPNGGKAFIDFFLGDESMRMLAKPGEFVNRKGIYPSLPDADKIQAVEMDDFDAQGFKEKTQEYQKIFLK